MTAQSQWSKRLVRTCMWLLGAALMLGSLNYIIDATARHNAAESLEPGIASVSDTHNGEYTAMLIFLKREKILLRLYRTADHTLLAERTYHAHGILPVWTAEALIYDTSDDNGAIALPPTTLDRWRAHLP